MTGISPKRQVLRILPPSTSFLKDKNITHARALQVLKIDELQASLNAIHKDVQDLVTKRRAQAIDKHNKATNIVSPSFQVGDFVLVRRATDRGHKLRFKWFGPCRVIALHGPLVYSITSLSDSKTERVHAARLIKYKDSLQGTTVPQDMLELADKTESRYEVIDKIIDIGEDKDEIWLQVVWDGLPDKRDWTWQLDPFLYTDIPDLVLDFLHQSKKKKLVNKLKRQLKISI